VSSKPYLSKSRIMSARQCLKLLYLEKNRPDLANITSSTESVFSTGHSVGDIAQQIYGSDDAAFILYEDGLDSAIRQTKELMEASPCVPIFEATFQYDDVLVRVDVLLPDGDAWRMVEVKASITVKADHHIDCAIQAWVIHSLGYPISTVSLAHVNKQFVYEGDGNYVGMLEEKDLTESVASLEADVLSLVEQARSALRDGEPSVDVGGHCSKPYNCAFLTYCWPTDVEYPITGLGGGRTKLGTLVAEGFRDIRDVPDERLAGASQRRIHRVTCDGNAEVLSAGVEFVTSLAYPRYYLDFETIAPAVPIWAGTSPYAPVPIQWSCHIENAQGDVRHVEFLDLSGEPPMRRLAEEMVDGLEGDGPILMYTRYEERVIRSLMDLFPDLARSLQSLVDRLVDLHPVVKRDYYHPKMLGSWSIKAVLPAIAPQMNYSNLEGINQGVAASEGFLEAIDSSTSVARRAELEEQLLRYCRFDTLAMMEIVWFFERHR
jgi:hypothetical protein